MNWVSPLGPLLIGIRDEDEGEDCINCTRFGYDDVDEDDDDFAEHMDVEDSDVSIIELLDSSGVSGRPPLALAFMFSFRVEFGELEVDFRLFACPM